MPRRNVYFDDELDQAIREHDLRLSEICQRAVRAEVRTLRVAALNDAEVARAAERLAADRSAQRAETHRLGMDVGSQWAREKATWDELSFWFAPHNGRVRDLVVLSDDHSLRDWIVSFGMGRDWDVHPDDYETLDRDNPFEAGIIDGATQVLRAVKPLMEDG